MNRDLGRHVYGVAAIVLGAFMVYRHNAAAMQQLQVLGPVTARVVAFYAAAAAALAGGLALQWRRTARLGAVVLGMLYLGLALLWIPGIVRSPLIYDRWGNFFEQFSYVPGALIVRASLAPGGVRRAARAAALGRVLFGVCVVSFTIEQAINLRVTADLVPAWLPPGQMFWALATTVAFALAAVAIVSGRPALLAARLLTAMLLVFEVLVWLPALIAAPRSAFVWSESTENLAIAAVAWILADSLAGAGKPGDRGSIRGPGV